MVYTREVRKDFPEKGDVVVFVKSIDHPYIPERKGIVRANMLMGYYILRPVEIGTMVFTGEQFNVGGMIPQGLMNMAYASENAKMIAAIQKVSKKYEGRISADILSLIPVASMT